MKENQSVVMASPAGNFPYEPLDLTDQSFLSAGNGYLEVTPSKVEPPPRKVKRETLAAESNAEIEIVPCKVCGDKSSGVHYGVITCEGCKGFFRRSQTVAKPYECHGRQNCTVDRTNRNRCQYCRWKKCIELGMSRDAVRFGRMSRKQRETVEGEVNLHKKLTGTERNRIDPQKQNVDLVSAVPDNSLTSNGWRGHLEDSTFTALQQLQGFSQEIATSTANVDCGDQLSTLSSVVNGYTVYSASPVSSGYSSSASHSSTPAPAAMPLRNPGSSAAVNSIETFNPLSESESKAAPEEDFSDEASSVASITKAVLTAHMHTAIYTAEQKQQLKMVSLDYTVFWRYSRMSHLEWWIQCATELTEVIRQVVDFAKLVPDFLKLPQEDQIMMLKEGAMDLAIIRMVTMYDLDTHTVIFGGGYVPVTLFHSGDRLEQKFVYDLFMFVRELASFDMSDTEMALYSAVVLTWPHRSALKNLSEIGRMYERFADCLQVELRSRRGDGAIYLFQRLLALSGMLRNLSAQHVFILNQFMKRSPPVVLPPLYKELFVADQ